MHGYDNHKLLLLLLLAALVSANRTLAAQRRTLPATAEAFTERLSLDLMQPIATGLVEVCHIA